MRTCKWSFVLLLCFFAPAASAQRQLVLQQIDLPHHYYYREMYLPQLTTGPSSVAWAPDGKSIVFSMAGSLWRQAPDSTTAKQLTAGPGYDYQPDWSPDGHWIVFARYHRDAFELHALDLFTLKTRQLTDGGAVNVEPRFSPDGRRIAFVSTQYNKRFHVFVAQFSGGALSGVERLTGETRSALPRYYYSPFDTEISPSWSPDGSEILFISNRNHLYGSGGIWRRRAERGAEAREIHSEETTWKARPDWARDGQRVVFSSYAGGQWHQLWVTTASGGSAFPLTYGEFDNTAPRWSPDGKRIAFISNREGNTSLWIADLPGGRQRRLVAKERKYAAPMARLRITVFDAAGKPTPARVSVTGADQRAYAPETAWMHADDGFDRSERPFEAHYFHTRGASELMVPAGRVEIEVMKGFEHRVERSSIDVTPQKPAALTVRLRSIALPAAAGTQWVSGDAHVHMNYAGTYRNTPKNLVAQAEAENLQIVHSLLVNKEQRIPDISYFTGKLDPASTATTLVQHSQEYHTSVWGHLGLLGLREHILLPDYAGYPQTAAASLYPSNAAVADVAHAQGALVGYVHPFDTPPDPASGARLMNTLPVDVALGKADYLEVVGFSNHRSTAAVWYRLLNCGFRLPTAAGTDAMANYASLHGPVGMSRVYVRVPAGPLNVQAWLDGLRAGRSFATNGPLLAFTLGGQAIGNELKLPAASKTVSFRAALRSIVPLDHFEVVCNGEVVKEIPLTGDRTSADASGTIPIGKSGWCVLRAWSEKATHPVLDWFPYATTSPVYVTVAGAAARSPADAAYFVAWIDRVIEGTRAHTDWNTPEERDTALKQLADARAVFVQRQK